MQHSMRKIIQNSFFMCQVIGFGSPSDSRQSYFDDQSDSRNEDEHRDELLQNVESRDLMEYGMIPEFVGRFPVTVSLSSLNRDSLVEILTEPKDALLTQYNHLFDMDKVRIWNLVIVFEGMVILDSVYFILKVCSSICSRILCQKICQCIPLCHCYNNII